jgi:hypothetical protein
LHTHPSKLSTMKLRPKSLKTLRKEVETLPYEVSFRQNITMATITETTTAESAYITPPASPVIIDYGSPMSITYESRVSTSPGSPMSLGSPVDTATWWPENTTTWPPESTTPENSTTEPSSTTYWPKRNGPIPTGPKAMRQAKAVRQDVFGRMLDRAPPKIQRKWANVRKPQNNSRRNGNASTTSATHWSRGDDIQMREADWDEWRSSQSRWMENRRKNIDAKRWHKRPANKLPKWVKQRPGL